jgi:predicted dehydrogenase
MKKLRFAIFGCGFWSQFQLGAWKEIEGVECVALFNRTRSKAEALAERFGVPKVYDDAEELLKNEELDFIDIITDVDTHEKYTLLGRGSPWRDRPVPRLPAAALGRCSPVGKH